MKIPRTTRGTSAPPPNISLQTASIRLSYATSTLRPRRQPQQPRLPTPEVPERLGSPFVLHQPRSRAGTPSTVASITESLPGQRTYGYWLRSSRESEWENLVNRLSTPRDLRWLIEHVSQMGDQALLQRCHGILVDCLVLWTGESGVREALNGIEIARVIEQAEMVGFWRGDVLPGVRQGIHTLLRMFELTIGIDRYSTPPTQTCRHYQ